MEIRITEVASFESMQPIMCRLNDIPVGGIPLETAIWNRIYGFIKDFSAKDLILTISAKLWPSEQLISTLAKSGKNITAVSNDGLEIAWVSTNGSPDPEAEKISLDPDSLVLDYPWHALAVNEQLVGNMKENIVKGKISGNVTIDGFVEVGEGSVLLPGVYIEGNVIIGKDCKIGPNCYIRGNTSVGNKCHIGQAVEIKNSLIMDKVSIGHLSYVGDSIICNNTNFGAGTITANLRHDGKNHRSMAGGELVETGRRKFGCIAGENVHTGIHTSIYPGRKLWSGTSTKPGDVVSKDLK